VGKRKKGHRQPGNSGGGSGSWTSNDIRGVLHNPIYIGIGPYPALIDEATWIKAQEQTIKDEGTGAVLGQIRRLVEETFGHVPDWMAAPDWITTSSAQCQKEGTKAFFLAFLQKMRAEFESD